MELDARIATLRMAETFVISRGAAGRGRGGLGRDPPRRRRGFGEAAPIERYEESPESALAFLEETGELSATTRSRSRRSMRGCRARRAGGEAAIDAALHDLQGKLVGLPVWRCSGSRGRPADLVDDLARRSRRHGSPGRAASAPVQAAEAEARRRRRARRRARAAVHGVADAAAPGGRERGWSLDEALERLPQLPSSASSTASSRCRPATRTGGLKRGSPLPIYVDEDCHTLARRRRLRRAGARDQRQAREVRRDPGGDPDGARRARARARRDARLHGRVGPRHRGGAQIASLFDHVDLDGNLLLARRPVAGRRARRRRPDSRPSAGPRCPRASCRSC